MTDNLVPFQRKVTATQVKVTMPSVPTPAEFNIKEAILVDGYFNIGNSLSHIMPDCIFTDMANIEERAKHYHGILTQLLDDPKSHQPLIDFIYGLGQEILNRIDPTDPRSLNYLFSSGSYIAVSRGFKYHLSLFQSGETLFLRHLTVTVVTGDE